MKLGVVLAALTISLWGSDTNVDFSVEKGTQAIYQSTKNPSVYLMIDQMSEMQIANITI